MITSQKSQMNITNFFMKDHGRFNFEGGTLKCKHFHMFFWKKGLCGSFNYNFNKSLSRTDYVTGTIIGTGDNDLQNNKWTIGEQTETYSQTGYVLINQTALSMNVISPLINGDVCEVGSVSTEHWHLSHGKWMGYLMEKKLCAHLGWCIGCREGQTRRNRDSWTSSWIRK